LKLKVKYLLHLFFIELELPNTKTRLTPTTPERRAFTSPKKTCPPVPMRLALPDLQRVKDGQDDESDNESLARYNKKIQYIY